MSSPTMKTQCCRCLRNPKHLPERHDWNPDGDGWLCPNCQMGPRRRVPQLMQELLDMKKATLEVMHRLNHYCETLTDEEKELLREDIHRPQDQVHTGA